MPLKKLKTEEIYEYSDELQKYYVGHTCDGKKRDAGHHVKPKMKNPDRTVLRTLVGSKCKVERVEKQYILYYRRLYGDNLLNETYMNIEDIPDAPVINDLRYVPAIVPEITRRKDRGYRVKWAGDNVKEFKSKEALDKMREWLDTEFTGPYVFVWNSVIYRKRQVQEYDTVEQLVERIESDIKAEINNQKLMSK